MRWKVNIGPFSRVIFVGLSLFPTVIFAQEYNCSANRHCTDMIPCKMVSNPSDQLCAREPTCAPTELEFDLTFIENGLLLDNFPVFPNREYELISEFKNEYFSRPTREQTYLIVTGGGATSPRRQLIYLERNLVPDTRDEFVMAFVDLEFSGGERDIMTTYANCVSSK